MATRVAAIGVTHWHSLYDAAYLRHLAQMEDVDLVGIHDDDPDLAAHRANELGGGIPTFTDYRRMVEEIKPDFVLALGRHDTMGQIAHYLLDSRIPFVMEKPMSYNAKELRGVTEKVTKTSSFVAVPLVSRRQPIVHYARRFIEEGAYGPMTHFYIRTNRPTSARYPAWGSPWMLDPQKSGGGILRNIGPVVLETFVYLTGEGEDIEVTGAQLSWMTHGQPVEDYASVLVRSRKGIIGTVEMGNCFPRDGSDAEMKVGFRDALLTSKDGVIKVQTSEGEEILPPGEWGDPYSLAVRQAIDDAASGGEPAISVHDCYRAVRLVDLAYIAAGNPYGNAEV